jgi:hypothetical protein
MFGTLSEAEYTLEFYDYKFWGFLNPVQDPPEGDYICVFENGTKTVRLYACELLSVYYILDIEDSN